MFAFKGDSFVQTVDKLAATSNLKSSNHLTLLFFFPCATLGKTELLHGTKSWLEGS